MSWVEDGAGVRGSICVCVWSEVKGRKYCVVSVRWQVEECWGEGQERGMWGLFKSPPGSNRFSSLLVLAPLRES